MIFLCKNSIMDKIQQLFVNNFHIYDSHSVKELYYKETDNVKPYISGGKYMSKRIYGSIEKKLHYKIERHYVFDNTRVSMCIFCVNKSFPFHTLYNLLNYYIFVLNKLNRMPVVNIILYLTNIKKLFPQSTDTILNEDNVNSGVTFLSEDEKTIIIYRKEELYKVLLHELIHYYEIDFHNYDNKFDKYFINKFNIQVKSPVKNINNPLALYEAYTDSVACYGHLITNVLFKNKYGDLNTLIKQSLTKEKKHYMLQAAKVYKFGNLSEDTHCFSYYIVKACIFKNFDKFIQFVAKQGLLLNNRTKHESFITFVKEIMNDEFFKELKRIRTAKIVLSSIKMTNLKW